MDTVDALEIFVEKDAIILQKYTAHGACPTTGEILQRM
ncbi:putative transition state regulator abh (plasmid) [Bacillus cereus AH820]|uniref:Putative transition state regulator abh n=1 Tax=Bacillus cereus (strain AH820) TaxID=405535 RepID=B7JTQ9_BACC0|nr:putative transition state regulator abh [Bacillus cereus AH820]